MSMEQWENLPFDKNMSQLVQILEDKTRSKNTQFFRILVSYYFAKVASMMRCKVATHDRGVIPVNMYAINLAASGGGKGHSMNILEEEVISRFRAKFLDETFPTVAKKQLNAIATKRWHKIAGISPNNPPALETVRDKVEAEFESFGTLPFSFDSGTTAAVKQMRNMLLMADAGSMNMEIDEIGSNLLGQVEVLNAFLELFDVGKIKQKLVKNTQENTRAEDLSGRTPANVLLFGTPVKLLNGAKTEEEFTSFIEIGYGRRCFFGYSRQNERAKADTAEDIYNRVTNQSVNAFLQSMNARLEKLANSSFFNTELTMSKDVSLRLIQYQMDCEAEADALPEHAEIAKAEITHRYFKALKIAGAYAFVNGDSEITETHLNSGIALAQASGHDFNLLLSRDRPYIKLARYIADVGQDVTNADLVEDLPFYKGPESAKREMMNLAIAWGYSNNIIIKKSYVDGIEFLRGESLKETQLSEMIVSYSNDIVKNYRAERVPFDQLHKLTQAQGMHWVSHHLRDGYRDDDHVIEGFNMIVLDIDDGLTTIDAVKVLLQDYKFHLYTTKRHTSSAHRYRVVLPINYELKLSGQDFKDFMNNFFEWLPFTIDSQTNQRARKWLSHLDYYYDNDGEVIDALQFIPKTTKNEERRKDMKALQSLPNLERWFIQNTGMGNRSNQLIKYALLLVDDGMQILDVEKKVLEINKKIQDPMSEDEVRNTILKTAATRAIKRDSKV